MLIGSSHCHTDMFVTPSRRRSTSQLGVKGGGGEDANEYGYEEEFSMIIKLSVQHHQK
jgi:hypothetical protein